MQINSSWQPKITLENLQRRSHILQTIRRFFQERNVLEVDTHLLASSTAIDPLIASFAVSADHNSLQMQGYLQTSPEFAMKRLLAAGSGSIFQICKAFRCEEQGRLHNPEFTMLEWYRLGFTAEQLMAEVDDLLRVVLQTSPAQQLSYAQLFLDHLGIDPHRASIAELKLCAQRQGVLLNNSDAHEDKDFWLSLLLSHCIEPGLGEKQPVFIHSFPASQAALAKITPGDPPLAQRFELYFKGLELANGYQELTDAVQQRQRFNADNQRRKELNLPQIPLDEQLLAALDAGMPECAGVALGVDRLIMLALQVNSIEQVIGF